MAYFSYSGRSYSNPLQIKAHQKDGLFLFAKIFDIFIQSYLLKR